jgi:hypothetical protein
VTPIGLLLAAVLKTQTAQFDGLDYYWCVWQRFERVDWHEWIEVVW